MIKISKRITAQVAAAVWGRRSFTLQRLSIFSSIFIQFFFFSLFFYLVATLRFITAKPNWRWKKWGIIFYICHYTENNRHLRSNVQKLRINLIFLRTFFYLPVPTQPSAIVEKKTTVNVIEEKKWCSHCDWTKKKCVKIFLVGSNASRVCTFIFRLCWRFAFFDLEASVKSERHFQIELNASPLLQ